MDKTQRSAPASSSGRIEQRIEIGDTVNELYAAPCDRCGSHLAYKLIRTSGASLSVFAISEEDCRNLDAYVTKLHASFKVDVVTKLVCLQDLIQELNSNGYFEAPGMHPARVRLIDRARLICNRLSKNGVLRRFFDEADNDEDDITAAFLLGCLATEVFWLRFPEDAVFEGYAHIEGRKAGRPLARAARRTPDLSHSRRICAIHLRI